MSDNVTPIRHAGWCSGEIATCKGECLRPLPTAEELRERDRAYRQTLACTTSHQLARQLLDLPEGKITFVEATGGEGTHDFRIGSLPWHVDWAKEIRIMITDGTYEVARGDGQVQPGQ